MGQQMIRKKVGGGTSRLYRRGKYKEESRSREKTLQQNKSWQFHQERNLKEMLKSYHQHQHVEIRQRAKLHRQDSQQEEEKLRPPSRPNSLHQLQQKKNSQKKRKKKNMGNKVLKTLYWRSLTSWNHSCKRDLTQLKMIFHH